MTAELAVDRFLSLLSRSSLLPEEKVQELLEEFSEPDSELADSSKIAEELVSRGVLTEWQAGMLLQGKHRGFILGPYRMLKPLGRGGMGAVFLAEHQRMRRRCAIKVLPSDHTKGETSLLDRFYREAQAVATLDHPNIVRAYDVNVSVENKREIHYLVMEYVEGQDLQQTVQERGGLPFREAADFVRQAAEGLVHAHEADLVHRDIKPANVLVDTKGVVKLLDLGLARFFSDAAEASLTQEMGETVLGTADYLAPEQALDSHNVDERADIYSLGQTFYFMLTGHPPFPEGTVAQRLMAHQMKAPEPITKDRPDAPAGLLAIIDRMIAKKPEERYQTAQEVADALAEWLQDVSGGSGSLRRTSPVTGDSGIHRPSERTLPKSDYREETDLGLAPLGDDRQGPSSKYKLPGAAGDSPSGSSSGRLAAPQEGMRPAPPDSGFDEDDEDDGSEYGLSGETPVVEKPKAEPGADKPAAEKPAEPEEDDLFSAPIPEGAPLAQPAAPSRAEGKKAPAKKGPAKKGAKTSDASVVSTLLDSAYFWIGIAVTVVLALIIAFAISRPPSMEAARQPIARPSESAQPAAESEALTEAAKTPSEEPEKAAAKKPKPAKAAPRSKAPESQKTPDGPKPKKPGDGPAKKAPGAPAEAKPPAKEVAKPKPQTKEPAEKKEPAKQPAAEKKPATEKQPAAEKKPAAVERTPAELNALFAGVRKVALELTSADKSKTSKINLMLAREAQTAVERVGAEPTSDAEDAAVLRLNFGATPAGGLYRLTLSGELACQVSDSEEEEEVVVWKHEGQVADVAPALLRRGTVHTTIREGVDDFFGEFVAAHDKAAEALEAKKPAPK